MFHDTKINLIQHFPGSEFTKNLQSVHFVIITTRYICTRYLSFKTFHMPKFITSIRLQEANEKDYAVLSREMKKNSFNPVLENRKNTGGSDSTFVFNSNSNKSLVDTTTLVSLAAATTGKKYSFTLFKEKSKAEF